MTHVSITLYLALSSVVMAAFVAHNPDANVRLIMSAYMVAALVAASAALIGYFDLVPGLYDIFTEFGRARGTFKDPNVLGAFLVPALLYAFNVVLTARLRTRQPVGDRAAASSARHAAQRLARRLAQSCRVARGLQRRSSSSSRPQTGSV